MTNNFGLRVANQNVGTGFSVAQIFTGDQEINAGFVEVSTSGAGDAAVVAISAPQSITTTATNLAGAGLVVSTEVASTGFAVVAIGGSGIQSISNTGGGGLAVIGNGAGAASVRGEQQMINTNVIEVMNNADGMAELASRGQAQTLETNDSNAMGNGLLVVNNGSGDAVVQSYDDATNQYGTQTITNSDGGGLFVNNTSSGSAVLRGGDMTINTGSVGVENSGTGIAHIDNGNGGTQTITTNGQNLNGDGVHVSNTGSGSALIQSRLRTAAGATMRGADQIITAFNGASINLHSAGIGEAMLLGGLQTLNSDNNILVGDFGDFGDSLISSDDVNFLFADGDIHVIAGAGVGSRSVIYAEGTTNLNAVGDVNILGGSGNNSLAMVQADSVNTINITADDVLLQPGTGNNADALLNSANGTGNVNITSNSCTNCGSTGQTAGSDSGQFVFTPTAANQMTAPAETASPAFAREQTASEPGASTPRATDSEPVMFGGVPQDVRDIINAVVALIANNARVESNEEGGAAEPGQEGSASGTQAGNEKKKEKAVLQCTA